MVPKDDQDDDGTGGVVTRRPGGPGGLPRASRRAARPGTARWADSAHEDAQAGALLLGAAASQWFDITVDQSAVRLSRVGARSESSARAVAEVAVNVASDARRTAEVILTHLREQLRHGVLSDLARAGRLPDPGWLPADLRTQPRLQLPQLSELRISLPPQDVPHVQRCELLTLELSVRAKPLLAAFELFAAALSAWTATQAASMRAAYLEDVAAHEKLTRGAFDRDGDDR